FGTNGGRGRCFPFFQEFAKCYVQADATKECLLQFEDYQECLHHKKELQRLAIIRKEWERKKAEQSASAPGIVDRLFGTAKA
ncbi:hypothetical protein HDU76_010718, partial [Blyttiomyces sp. JEL0837]